MRAFLRFYSISSKISNNFEATGLTKSGPGTLVLSGSLNNSSGNIAINGGTLEADGDEAIGITGVITLGTASGTNNASLLSLAGYRLFNTNNVASQPSGALTSGNSVASSYFSTVNLGTAFAPSNLTLDSGNTSATGSTLEVGGIGGTGNLTLDSAGTGTGPASITVESAPCSASDASPAAVALLHGRRVLEGGAPVGDRLWLRSSPFDVEAALSSDSEMCRLAREFSAQDRPCSARPKHPPVPPPIEYLCSGA